MTIRHIESLFRPAAVLAIGAPADAPAEELLQRLALLPEPQRALLHLERPGWRTLQRLHKAPRQEPAFELAVVFDASLMTPALVRTLAQAGCHALLWTSDVPVPEAVLRAGRNETLRVLGPGSAGTAQARGLCLSSWSPPAPGNTALIAQSRSIAAAALDWAAGHALGFSWVAATGNEADVDVADLLDYAAVDPGTQAVVLQLSRIRSPRKFMSAARACARAKPVVVLQTPDAEDENQQPADPVLSAAFRRAGLVEVDRVTALFSALAALDRVGDAGQARIAVLGTGGGICQLARASLWREQLQPVALDETTRQAIQAQLPKLYSGGQWLDIGLASDEDTLTVLRLALESRALDVALFVRSPAPGQDDEAFARKLVAARLRERLAVVFLGQARAAPALRICSEGGIAAFASVEQAARALRYRRDHRRTQEMLMQTPTLDPLAHGQQPPQLAVPAKLKTNWVLPAAEAQELLAAYGLQPAPWAEAAGRGLRVRLKMHPQMGIYLTARLDPASTAAPTAYALPPLDDVLAAQLLRDLGLGDRTQAPPGLRAADYATAVARLAQLAVEQPRLHEAELRLLPAEGMAEVGYARITASAHPPVERARLALTPYPLHLQHRIQMRDGSSGIIRPIRPTDEPTLIRMLSQLDPETVRLRFFRYIRQFTHAMAARMTQIDYDREMSFVAVTDEQPGEVAGVATLASDPTGADAEFAVLVREGCGHKGLGRLLMQDVLRYAEQTRVGRVHGDVLLENSAMLGLAQSLGFTRQRHPDDPGCVRVVINPGERRSTWAAAVKSLISAQA